MSAITSIRYILAKDPKGASLSSIMDMLDEDYRSEALRALASLSVANQVTESKVDGERWYVLTAPKPQDFIASPGMNIDKYAAARDRIAMRAGQPVLTPPQEIQWPTEAPKTPAAAAKPPASPTFKFEDTVMSKSKGPSVQLSNIPEGRRGRLRPECLTGMAAWLLFSSKQGDMHTPMSLEEIVASLNLPESKVGTLRVGIFSMMKTSVIKPAEGKTTFVWNNDLVFPFQYASDQGRAEAAIAKLRAEIHPVVEAKPEEVEPAKVAKPNVVSIGKVAETKARDPNARLSVMLDQANEDYLIISRRYIENSQDKDRIALAKLIGRIDTLNALLSAEDTGAISSAG